MSSWSFLHFLLIGCFTLSFTACRQAQDPPESTVGASEVHGSQANLDKELPHRLVGKWHGKLEIDQQAVTQLFKDAGREDQLETALDTYQNMEMTMGFEEGGKMTMSIKIVTDETSEENHGLGHWELVRDEGNMSIVKSQEEGSQEQEIEMSFKDPDHFQMLPKGPFRNAAVIKFSRIR